MLSFCLLLSLAHMMTADKEKHGLIIVDLQSDFIDPNGSLSVFGEEDSNSYLDISSAEYVDRINSFLENTVDDYDFVVYSLDSHPSDHCSFAETMQVLGADVSPFDTINTDASTYIDDEAWTDYICVSQNETQVLWETHCVRGTPGSRLFEDVYDIRPDHDSQRVLVWRDSEHDEEYTVNYELANRSIISSNASFLDDLNYVQQDLTRTLHSDISQVFYVFKGGDADVDSYSALKENDGATDTGLYSAMLAYDYSPDNTHLTVLGIGYDYAVALTVSDAVDLGYIVTVMDQLTAPIFPDDTYDVVASMIAMGVTMDYATEWTYSDEVTSDEESDTGFVLGITALILIVVVPVIIVIWRNLKHHVVKQKKTQKSTLREISGGDEEITSKI